MRSFAKTRHHQELGVASVSRFNHQNLKSLINNEHSIKNEII